MKKTSTGQIIANIITGLILVGLIAFIIACYILDPTKYSDPMTKSLVAFATTFIVLIIVTASIYVIKALPDIWDKIVGFFTKLFRKNRKTSLSIKQSVTKSDKMMAAVIAAAVHQFQFDSNGQIAVGFRVRELLDVNTPWTTFSKNDYHKSGGSR